MAADIIEFKNVFCKYPQNSGYALENLNISVLKGEFLAVMGKNGSGKTTFCKLINGIIPHLCAGRLSGLVLVDGKSTVEQTVPQLALKAGIVLDDPDVQLFTSTVRDEAAFGPQNLLLPQDEILERIKYALSAVGLKGFEDRTPSTLSGGEKQRLSIAAALAMKGEILILDDPLCRLDPDGAREVMAVLKNLRDQFGITIVMATCESDMTAKYADRVCVLNNGRIAALDKAENIFSDCALLEENGIQPVNYSGNRNEMVFCNLSGISARTEAYDPRSKNPVIQITDFSYNYGQGDVSIKNINLTIYENDFIAIIGKNGCGKTTLLKNITGLLRPSGGDILIHGRSIKKMSISGISKEAGFVMQNPDTQLFTDSVFKETVFALKNMRLSKTEIKKRALEAIAAAGLEEKADDYPHALSRTDRTRTVIACVLAMGCKIVIFDEIDAGNDYPGNVKIMNIARDLHQKGFTIIFVTHNMFLANNYARRIVKMERDGIVSDSAAGNSGDIQ